MPVAARRFTLAGLAFVGCRTDDGRMEAYSERSRQRPQKPPRRWSLCRRPRCVACCRAANRPGSRDLPRSVHYWTDVATFSRFYRYARWVPTTPTGNLKWEYSMASAQILALGPFYSAPITSYSNATPSGFRLAVST